MKKKGGEETEGKKEGGREAPEGGKKEKGQSGGERGAEMEREGLRRRGGVSHVTSRARPRLLLKPLVPDGQADFKYRLQRDI